jgi:hypothetical protein
MTERKRSYDPACFELAERFLFDEPALKDRASDLAAHIQSEIESWIEYERDHRDDPG